MVLFVGNVEGFTGLEAMLPDPVDAHEAAPEMTDKGDIQPQNQYEHGVDPVHGGRQARISTESDEGPDHLGRVKIEHGDQGGNHRHSQNHASQNHPVNPFVLALGKLRTGAVQTDLGPLAQPLPSHIVSPLGKGILGTDPAAKGGTHQGIGHHQQAGDRQPQTDDQIEIREPDLPVKHHEGALHRIDAEQATGRDQYNNSDRGQLQETPPPVEPLSAAGIDSHYRNLF